jgi:hypothetical protein
MNTSTGSPPRGRYLLHLRGYNPRPALLVEPGWAPHIFVNNMAPHWRGLEWDGAHADCMGANYYLVPAPLPGAVWSAHYEPTSPYFQSLFGVYILPPVGGRRVPKELIPELGRLDFVGWLRRFGDRAPLVRTERVAWTGAPPGPRWRCRIEWRGKINLGSGNAQLGHPLMDPPPASRWSALVGDYQEVTTPTDSLLWYHRDYLVAVYANGVVFTDRTGRAVDTLEQFPAFRAGLERMLDAVRIIDDGSPFSAPPARGEPREGAVSAGGSA